MADTRHIDIDYVANLARLALTPEEKTKFARQLADVLEYVEQLSEVDVSGVEPTAHAFEVVNVLQDDEPASPLSVADAMRNAPASRDNMIIVPKVVDDA